MCRLFVSVCVHDNFFVPICPSGHFSIFDPKWRNFSSYKVYCVASSDRPTPVVTLVKSKSKDNFILNSTTPYTKQ